MKFAVVFLLGALAAAGIGLVVGGVVARGKIGSAGTAMVIAGSVILLVCVSIVAYVVFVFATWTT